MSKIAIKGHASRGKEVIETPKGKIAHTIKCLTDNKIYYPYSQDILLFNDNCIAKGLVSKIIEDDK